MMADQELGVGDLLRSLVIQIHAVLRRPGPDADALRELMWRAAALKGQLRGVPSNPLMCYLDRLQRSIARVYAPSPTPADHASRRSSDRHAA